LKTTKKALCAFLPLPLIATNSRFNSPQHIKFLKITEINTWIKIGKTIFTQLRFSKWQIKVLITEDYKINKDWRKTEDWSFSDFIAQLHDYNLQLHTDESDVSAIGQRPDKAHTNEHFIK